MKDDNGKVFTTTHSRFQACCLEGCGLISAHQSAVDAMDAAEKHSCLRVEVYDCMTRKHLHPVVWKRDENGGRTIDEFLRKLKGPKKAGVV